MNVTVRVLAALLGLLISARVHVTLWLPGGAPVSVLALWLILGAVAVILAAAVWVMYAVPRQGWPRLIWRTVTA